MTEVDDLLTTFLPVLADAEREGEVTPRSARTDVASAEILGLGCADAGTPQW
jgi:hypothetical protein